MCTDHWQTSIVFLLLFTTVQTAPEHPAEPVPANSTSNRSLPPSSLAPPPANASSGCELDVLTTLGWQQAFNPSGYSIAAVLPLNCSSVTWQSLGCLNTLTNLTLTGSLPDLPDSWAASNSFAALQVINMSSASLAGSLPSSWASPLAFPSLKVLNFSVTQLSGTLPLDWGQRGSFAELEELHLGMTDITGGQQYCACCTDVHMALNAHLQLFAIQQRAVQFMT